MALVAEAVWESEPVTFSVAVEVRLKAGVADPEGATVERALPALGFGHASNVTIGKLIRFDIEAPDADRARAQVEDLCGRFLTNPVIEDATVHIDQAVTA